MKWIEKHCEEPKSGDLRTKKKFLWWPLKIGREIRWMESVVIVQKYFEYNVIEYPLLWGDPIHYEIGRWKNLGFFDESNAIQINVDKDDPYKDIG